MSLPESKDAHGTAYGSFQSAILFMATPLQRQRSTSERLMASSTPGSVPSYFTRVFETEAPEVILYTDSHAQSRPSTITKYIPPTTQTAAFANTKIQTNSSAVDLESAPLIISEKAIWMTKKKMSLMMVIFTLVCFVVGASVVFFECLNDPTIALSGVVQSSFATQEGDMFQCDFLMEAKNNNIQRIKINSVDIKLCISPLFSTEQVCIDDLRQSINIDVSGYQEQPFKVIGTFNMTSSSLNTQFSTILRTGNFLTSMRGTSSYSPFNNLDMTAEINTSIRVEAD
eukprot:TRINITY_DN2901_c0_g1_i1.p1 TRINITY_DN2901_c0_g1~~TRINITY_DN2901_c0_g1_i1.p1  ORF type:complete len:285 (+),score=57.25 TRINITY_DN2901_c0_g1_i1:64-918(+)